MAAKDARNLIIGLITLIIGIFVLTRIGGGYTSNIQLPAGSPAGVSSVAGAIQGVGNLLMLGLGIIVIFLIPVWLAKRSGEKKLKKYPAPPEPQQKK